MILGTGDISQILTDREGAIFFASGHSNSSNVTVEAYRREVELLLEQPKDRCLFYFSTVSQYYTDNSYTQYKKNIEQVVRDSFENYNILRIGNIDFGKNPNTFLNNLKGKKERGESITIRDEYRYMISKSELLLLTDNLPLTGKNEINVFGTMKKIIDLI